MNKERVKKIFIIFFIFFIVGFVYFFIKGVFLDIKISEEDRKKQEQFDDFEKRIEKEVEKTKNANIEFNKLNPEKKEFIMAKYYKLERVDCEKIKENELRTECFSVFDFNNIVEGGDMDLCDNMTFNWRDMCIYKLAVSKKNDWQNCEKISDKYIHDMCLKPYAIDFNDIELCKKMNYGYQSCVERVRAINNGWGGDIRNCTSIQKNEYYWMCINMSGQDCETIEDDYDRDRCVSAAYFANVLQLGERGDCSMLPLETYRKTCEMYFDNNKTHIDFDGDGVDNGMELFVSTNPLVYDGDAKEYEGYETQWAVVFDNVYYKTTEKLKELTIDTDGDGLRDYEEKEVYGTDFQARDTDEDGIWDLEEIEHNMNPNIKDAGKDIDEDGIDNEQEDLLGYDKFNPDMDNDGLLDGEELNKYGTDPKVADTDGDGYIDGDEVKNGYDPNSAGQ